MEFLELARSRLNPGGVIVSNVIGSVAGPTSKLFRSMYKTYRAVFPSVTVHPVNEFGSGETLLKNLILVAGEGAAPSKEFLLQRWAAIRRRAPGAPDLTTAIRNRYDADVPTNDVPVLTDDYAPTDALLLLFD